MGRGWGWVRKSFATHYKGAHSRVQKAEALTLLTLPCGEISPHNAEQHGGLCSCHLLLCLSLSSSLLLSLRPCRTISFPSCQDAGRRKFLPRWNYTLVDFKLTKNDVFAELQLDGHSLQLHSNNFMFFFSLVSGCVRTRITIMYNSNSHKNTFCPYY